MASSTDRRESGLAILGDRASEPGGIAGGPQGTSRRDAGRVLRALALVAVAIGLAVLTAAACVLSYGSIHALATEAGVSQPLARIYPLILDALLVLAGCSVLALRGAGIVSRVYAWLCLLVLLAGLAAGGVVHNSAIAIPKRPAEIAAAIIPFALVLIGFGLLLALLRSARLRRLGQRRGAQWQLVVPSQPAVPATAAALAQAADPAEAPELTQAPKLTFAEAPAAAAAAEDDDQAAPGPDGDDAAGAAPDADPLSPVTASRQPDAGAQLQEAQPKTGKAATAQPLAFDRPHSSPTPPEG